MCAVPNLRSNTNESYKLSLKCHYKSYCRSSIRRQWHIRPKVYGRDGDEKCIHLPIIDDERPGEMIRVLGLRLRFNDIAAHVQCRSDSDSAIQVCFILRFNETLSTSPSFLRAHYPLRIAYAIPLGLGLLQHSFSRVLVV